MSLQNKTAVVLGGTGGVGEGIVLALLKAGATVVVPTRSSEKAAQLAHYVGAELAKNLVIKTGTVTDEVSANELGLYLHQTYKHIDLAVASLGGWHQGYPLTSYPLDKWNQVVADNLTSHFLAIKTLVPLLQPQSGAYVHINGFASEEHIPMAGPIAAMAAAQKSMIQTLALELSRTNIRAYEYILGRVKTRARLRHSQGHDDWYFPEEIGEHIIQQTLADRQDAVVQYLRGKS